MKGLQGWFTLVHRDRFGRVIWRDEGPNIYHDEGEEHACKVLFSEVASVPAAYYLGLDNRGSLAEADNLAALVDEPSSNGYQRQAVNSDNTDFTVTQDPGSGDWQAKTKVVTFVAPGGAWGPVNNILIATSSDGSGKLISSKPLKQERSLSDGEELECTFLVRFKEAS